MLPSGSNAAASEAEVRERARPHVVRHRHAGCRRARRPGSDRGDRRPAVRRPDEREWWRSAVIYEVYPRSFADANGDGIGDLAGVRSRLPYLVDLGIDAMWFTPWYRSPLKDGGYDVADYRAIDPAFGSLEEAEQLIAEAAAVGIRTIVDIVPNHVSVEHEWFQAALASPPGSPERARFWFREGRGPNGDEMPTAWPSPFSGTTWTRTTNPDGTPGEWYLHLFASDQPDLNWDHPDVRREHEDIIRFWFDRGVAGIRIDSAALLVKDPALPEIPGDPGPGEHPNTDRDELHAIYRSLARDRGRLSGHAGPGGRAVDRRRRALREVPPPGRAPHRVQLRLPRPPLGRRQPARVDRRDARRPRAGRRAGDLADLQPRHHPTRDPLRAGRHRVRLHHQAARDPRRHRPRATTGTRGVPPLRRAARLALHLPGRGARPRRGAGPARRPAPGPDALPLRRRGPGPRRLPRAAPVVGHRGPVRLQPRRRRERAVAPPAGRVGRR